MTPRSSRNHSTHVPALSMMASTPHVGWPWRCHATMGNVPATPRPTTEGRSSPTQASSMAPVPNVILAIPGRTHP